MEGPQPRNDLNGAFHGKIIEQDKYLGNFPPLWTNKVPSGHLIHIVNWKPWEPIYLLKMVIFRGDIQLQEGSAFILNDNLVTFPRSSSLSATVLKFNVLI